MSNPEVEYGQSGEDQPVLSPDLAEALLGFAVEVDSADEGATTDSAGFDNVEEIERNEERAETILEKRAGSTEISRSGTPSAMTLFVERAGRFPLLTAAQVVELSKLVEKSAAAEAVIKGKGRYLTEHRKQLLQADIDAGRAAKERMINSNLRLVISIAKHYVQPEFPLAELVNEGVIGMTRAVEKFDWRKGYKFSTYATWWIRQACARAVMEKAHNIRFPINVVEEVKKVSKATKRLEQELGREPTPAEIAVDVGLSEDEVTRLQSLPKTSASLDKPVGHEDGDGELIDLMEDEAALSPVDQANLGINRDILSQLISKLPEPERAIILARFGFSADGEHDKEMTLEDVAAEKKLTREDVRGLERRALNRLNKLAKEDGLEYSSFA